MNNQNDYEMKNWSEILHSAKLDESKPSRQNFEKMQNFLDKNSVSPSFMPAQQESSVIWYLCSLAACALIGVLYFTFFHI